MSTLPVQRHELAAQVYARTGSSRAVAQELDVSTTAVYGLLKHPDVQRRVRELTTQRFARAEITAERVLIELARIGFADIRDFFNDNGDIVPLHLLNDDMAAAVAGCDTEMRMSGAGQNAVPVFTKKIKLVGKMEALKILAQHFKIIGEDSDGVNVLANALAARLNNARRRDFAARSDVVDAEVVTGRKEYGVEADPSNPDIVTPPRLELPEADPESINNHSVTPDDAVYSREAPRPSPSTASEADDEDLSR